MHLFKKWSKYAFAYASMQMHNYPKPSHYYHYILGKVAGNKYERYKIQICVCLELLCSWKK